MHFPAEVPYTSALAAAKALRAKDYVTAADEGLYAAGCINALRASGTGWNQGPQAALSLEDDDDLADAVEAEFAAPPDGTQSSGFATGLMLALIRMLIVRAIESLDHT